MDPIRIRIRHAYRYQYISLIHPLFCHFANNVLQITTTLFPQPLSQCGVFSPGGGGGANTPDSAITDGLISSSSLSSAVGLHTAPGRILGEMGWFFATMMTLSLSLSLCTGQYTVKKKIFSCTQKACWPGYQKSPAVPE